MRFTPNRAKGALSSGDEKIRTGGCMVEAEDGGDQRRNNEEMQGTAEIVGDYVGGGDRRISTEIGGVQRG